MTLLHAWITCSSLPVSSGFAMWRSMQAYCRSQCFYTCRVLSGQGELTDKIQRVGRRSCADALTLLHDSSDEQFRLCGKVLDSVGDVDELEPFARIAQRFNARSHSICLAAWMDIGRDGRCNGMLGSG